MKRRSDASAPVPIVMTMIGADRPGLVESVARIIAGHHGNWLDSRMAQMAGQFAGILQFEVPEAHIETLSAALRELKSMGLNIHLIVGEPAAQISAAPSELTLEVIGQDRPGIIREISQAVSSRGINVDELRTELVDAPMSAEKLFRASARLTAADGIDEEALRSDLEKIAADLVVDVTLGS